VRFSLLRHQTPFVLSGFERYKFVLSQKEKTTVFPQPIVTLSLALKSENQADGEN
jgi:hypothetical protein